MCHYEMALDGNGPRDGRRAMDACDPQPRGLDSANTRSRHVQLADGLDAHCARAAGATIALEPADQFYGDRTYRAIDIEGHMWTFAQHVRDVSRAEAEASLGQAITATKWA